VRPNTLSVTITIGRAYGAAGRSVAQRVAATLGYVLLADDVSARVAERLGTTEAEVLERAGGEPSLVERMLRALRVGTDPGSAAGSRPSTDFDDEVLAEIDRLIRETAAVGNAVILGRSAGFVLGRDPGAMRVFLHAATPWRVARIVAAFDIDPRDALAELERVDADRAARVRERFDARWGDRRHYDLILDVGRIGIDGAVAALVAAVRAA